MGDVKSDCGYSLGGGALAAQAGTGNLASWAWPLPTSANASLGGIVENALVTGLARQLFLRSLEHLQEGFLELVCQDKSYFYGRREDPLNAVLAVHNNRFFEMALAGGDIGVGESYQEGDWSTPDLVSVIRFGIRNLEHFENTHSLLKTFKRWTDVYSHRRNRNTRKAARETLPSTMTWGTISIASFLTTALPIPAPTTTTTSQTILWARRSGASST